MGKRPDAEMPSLSDLRAYAHLLPDPYCLLDESGDIILINQAGAEILGCEDVDIEGESLTDILDPDGAVRFRTRYSKLITEDRVSSLSLTVANTDPDPVSVSFNINPQYDEQGRFVRAHCLFRDITDEKQQKTKLERFRTLLDQSYDGICIIDTDEFEIVDANDTICEWLGYSRGEILSMHPWEIEVTMSDPAKWPDGLEQLRHVEYMTYEGENCRKDGSTFPVEVRLSLVSLERDYVVSQIRDLTERRKRERELEATNQRLESLIEATPLTVIEVDTDGTVIRWNDEATNMFGWSREQVLGEFNPMSPDEQNAEFASHEQRALSGERIRAEEVRRETKDGDELDLLLSVAPITDSDGETTSVLAVFEDITEQKQLEARLRSLQETAQQLSGAESSEEIGAIAVNAAAEILDLEITGIWEHNPREGVLVPITETPAARDLFTSSPRLKPGDGLAWDAFESGDTQVYDDVHTEGQPHNPSTEIRSEIFVPLGDYGLMSTGSVSTQVFSETDVDLFRILGATVKSALARASREEKLHRQNERLDQFASVVAHDLRNPLSVAVGFLEIAKETGNAEHLEKVESAHGRIERLIEDLLTLARGETTVEEVNVESITTEAWGYVDTEEATLIIADEVPTVTGNKGRLTQLFENLFRNAVEHGGADVTVTVGRLVEDDEFYVEDTGSGIPRERQDEVFKHGVTSSEEGAGFGLSIVADVAKAHDWTVSVTDGTDGGARFEFKRSN